MSKTPKSASKSRSKSKSRSLSRSSSRSRSRSRKKYRHSSRSRSRSRSRSHSPSHNRERNYPREYQNNREFRGYHRGFRRPYYFRGRGRGFFPRGRFQRGRGGGYNNNNNNNYRPNNWQNYRQHPQQQQQQQQQLQQQQHYPHSPRRGRSRTPKKRSGSPRSHSHSRHSDRSSSPRSKRSRRSPSSSRSSSPKRKSAPGSAKQSTKDVKEERSASKEVQKGGGGGGGGGDGEVLELTVASGGADEGSGGSQAGGDWLQVTDYITSPKRDGSQVRSAVIVGQATPTASPTPNCSNATGNGAASRQPVGGAPSTKSPSQKSPTPVFSGFGFFSKDDSLADKEAISTAFKKFLEEHNNKKKQSARENGRDIESNGLDGEQQEKGNGKSPEGIFDKVSGPRAPKGTDVTKGGNGKSPEGIFDKVSGPRAPKGTDVTKGGNGKSPEGIFDKVSGPRAPKGTDVTKGGNGKSPEGIFDKVSGPRAPKGTDSTKGDKEKYKFKENCDDSVSLNSLLRTSPFCEDGEEEKQERVSKPRPKAPRRDWDATNEDPKPKSNVALSARELFEERFGKWEDLAYIQAVKDDDLEAMAEELYRSQRHDKAAAIAAALAKRGMAGMFGGRSPEKSSRERRKEKAQVSSPSPSPPPKRNSEREKASGKKGEFNVRLDSLRDDMASSSEVLTDERWSSRDLVHPSKKEQEFRSIFQHVQATQHLPKSPSELFAQHIVTIVHHVKAQHFPASGMTLNERFAMYQRRAAAANEMTKPRKSPEIHRRIDVSPSAFKKHSQLFEGTKSSGDGSYKDEGQKGKGDSNDLRLDIEWRKKCSTRERDYKWDGERDPGDSPEPSRERSADVSSKHHKKSKKCKKTHSRSRSSSSSSESHRGGDRPREEPELKEEGFDRARLGPRDYVDPMERGRPRGGLQFRIRGRGWNRGNYQGSSTNGNPLNMPMHTKNEDWDPEFTPKSRRYYLHDDREWEGEPSWLDNRGRGRVNRGRFIFRKATVGANNNNNNNNNKRSPKWTHDKFQGDGEEGDAQEEDPEQDHNEAGSGDVDIAEQ